jgi:hypothetical protein
VHKSKFFLRHAVFFGMALASNKQKDLQYRYIKREETPMKQTFRLSLMMLCLLCAVLALPAFRVPAKAESETPPDQLEYSVSKDGVIIEWCARNVSVLVIPEYIEGYPVIAIASRAFGDCKALTEVTLPSSIISIGDNAFEKCSSLSSITIPDNVTSIGNNAFRGCSSLSSVNILGSGTTIAEYAFYGCSNLSSVNISGSINSIGEYAFGWCSSLNSIDFPSGLTSIGSNAFEKCSILSSIHIPNSVTSIGNQAFINCGKLISFTVPPHVTKISYKMLSGCSSLSSVSLHPNIGFIDGEAFSGCSSLEFINIPDSITSFGNAAFKGCTSLTSIVIPDGFTTIEPEVFVNCSKLTSVTIPSGVTVIAEFAFGGCSSLTSVTIPNTVNYIRNYAFSGCTRLKSIDLPDSIILMGQGCFAASGLSSIVIPPAVTTLSNETFANCGNLQSVTIHQNVIRFGKMLFWNVPVFIRGYLNSPAHEYANENKIPFLDINEPDERPIYTTDDGFIYTKNALYAAIVGYTGSDVTPWVPEGLDGKPVNIIESGAFAGCNLKFKFVTILSTIQAIGEGMLEDTSVVIRGRPNTAAQRYAEQYGHPFVDIDAPLPIQTTNEGLQYTNDSEKIVIVGYTGSNTDPVIPEVIDGLPVAVVDREAFSKSGLKSVTIPPSVKAFGDNIIPDKSIPIRGVPGSIAQLYAEENGHIFVEVADVPQVLPGDADNDGAVGIGDLEAIVNFLLSQTPCASIENADANKDGNIDIQDVLWIVDMIIG